MRHASCEFTGDRGDPPGELALQTLHFEGVVVGVEHSGAGVGRGKSEGHRAWT